MLNKEYKFSFLSLNNKTVIMIGQKVTCVC